MRVDKNLPKQKNVKYIFISLRISVTHGPELVLLALAKFFFAITYNSSH